MTLPIHASCPRCGQRDVIFVNTDREDLTRDTMVCRGACQSLAEGPSRPHLRQLLREAHSSRLLTDGGDSGPQSSPRRSVFRRVR